MAQYGRSMQHAAADTESNCRSDLSRTTWRDRGSGRRGMSSVTSSLPNSRPAVPAAAPKNHEPSCHIAVLAPEETWLSRHDPRRSRVSRGFTAALNATLVSGTGLPAMPGRPAVKERTVASRRDRHTDSGPIRRLRNLRPLPARSRGPIGVACGAASHGSPAGVMDVPAPGTIRRPPSHRPLAARGGRCAPRPDSVRLSLHRVATSRAGWESPCLMPPTVRKARSSRTSPPNRSLDRDRNQTRMDWINEWTRDQGNERCVASGTCRM